MEMNDTFNYIVNKFDINLDGRYFIDIPEMVGSVALVKLFAELGFKKGAEIGVDRGLFSEYMSQNIPGLKLICVDPWLKAAYDPKLSQMSVEQDYFEGCYQETVKRLAPYNCQIIRKTSMEALKDVPDESLDFVYIDANHDFVNFSQDLHYWIKKVRPGGIIAGHDYVNYSYRKFNHVKRALEAYAICYRMLPLFAVMYDGNGLKRDKYRSWFWVKK